MKSSFPTVSIIMGAYNAGAFIQQTVQSILNQNYPQLEILVTDDASTDDTFSLLKSFSDPRMRVFRNLKNQGSASVRNRGLKFARGAYIHFFDHDDIMLPGSLRKRVEFLEGHPEAKVVFGYTAEIIGKNGRPLRQNVQRGIFPNRAAFETYRKNLKYLRLQPLATYDLVRQFFPIPLLGLGNLLFRKDFVERAGQFDAGFKVIDDSDYIFRLIRHSPFYFVDAPVKYYRFHGENQSCRASQRRIRSEKMRIEARFNSRLGDA